MRCLRWARALALACCGVVLPVEAVTVRDYLHMRDSAEVDKFKSLRIYLSGVGAGYAWASHERSAEHLPPLFCLPPEAQDSIDFSRLIDDEIGQPYVTGDLAVEQLLLSALEREFACPRPPAGAASSAQPHSD